VDPSTARKEILHHVAEGSVPFGGELVAMLIDQHGSDVLADNDVIHDAALLIQAALEVAEERGRLRQERAALLFLEQIRVALAAEAENKSTAMKALANAGSHALAVAAKLMPRAKLSTDIEGDRVPLYVSPN
jgi:hypothetical protein